MPWTPLAKYCWDFWFARAKDKLHVFYLQASRLECRFNPDLRHDLASVGHAVLTPYGWRESEPDPALAAGDGDAWDNRSIWTGSVIQHAGSGRFHMFYTARGNHDSPIWTPHEWQRPQQIGVAVSDDLNHWERTPASREAPVIPNPGPGPDWDGVNWRDPYLTRETDGLYYAFICARPPSRDGRYVDDGGIVAYVGSDDLESWDFEPSVLIQSEDFYQLEVPQVFWRKHEDRKRLYLVFSAQEKDCSHRRREKRPEACETGTYYMRSGLVPLDSVGFPPLREPADLLAPGWFAGRILDPEGSSPMLYGFQWADERGRFAGGLSDPMPIQFRFDGTIELEALHSGGD